MILLVIHKRIFIRGTRLKELEKKSYMTGFDMIAQVWHQHAPHWVLITLVHSMSPVHIVRGLAEQLESIRRI